MWILAGLIGPSRNGSDHVFEIVTICGSMRFYPQMIKAAERLTADGVIVLMPFVTVPEADADLKDMLDQMHFNKIAMSSSILVVSEWGNPPYVGESTEREIKFATDTGKNVFWEYSNVPVVPLEHLQ